MQPIAKYLPAILALIGGQWMASGPACARSAAPRLHPSVCILQDGSAQQQKADDAEQELPRLLLLIQRPDKAPARRGDPITALSNTLETALNDTKKLEVVRYSPDQPSIKRALLEHTVAASDLIEPIKPDALQRLAHAIGARYALEVHPTFDKQGFDTDLRFLAEGDNQLWRTVLVDRVAVAATNGRRHFKPDALVALTVDAITARLGYPSHLAANIQIAPPRVIATAPQEQKKITKEAAGPAGQTGGATTPGDANGSKQNSKQNQNNAQTARKSDTQQQVQIEMHPAPNTKPSTAQKQSPASKPSPADEKRMASEQRHAPSPESSSASAPPAPAPAHPDYANAAQHYQQAGDLPNAIMSLRRAIDLDPYNPALRRQLIQAYVDRHMADAALEEAKRAKLLLPDDTSLDRLYGDTLLAKGDLAGALKLFRELVQRAPKDVAAQVALGDALLTDNRFSEAVSAYEAAAQIDPKSALPHRRLARIYAERAESDPGQYQESLKQIALARALTPPTDIDTYMGDYVALMRRMDGRLRDMADALQSLYEAGIQGKKSTTELQRATEDMKERAKALADYLDQVPPAAGQDDAHQHYSAGAALLLQAIVTFRGYLADTSKDLSDARGALQLARVDTLSELNTASKLLEAARSASHPNRSEDTNGTGDSQPPAGSGS